MSPRWPDLRFVDRTFRGRAVVIAEQYWPFDSQGGDRIHGSDKPAAALSTLFSDGVVPSLGLALQVTQNSPAAANVLVGLGHGWVRGRWYQLFSAAKVITVPANNSGNPRIDRIVLRRSFVNRSVTAEIISGTPTASPAAPALTQVDAGTWEVSLAQIAVANNFTTIVNANITDERTYVAATQTSPVPAGVYFPYGGTSAPSGYLMCDGSAVNRTTYAGLFAIIGTGYGAGNGSTTFNVPDSRGRSLVGVGTHADVNAVGKTDGITTVANRRMSHKHVVNESPHGHGVTDPPHAHTVNGATGGSGSEIVSTSTGTIAVKAGLVNSSTTGVSVNASTTGISVGPQTGAEPTDTVAFLTGNVIIKT